MNKSEKFNELLTESNALMGGHFLLTSGLHSAHYIEKFRLLENPRIANQVFHLMAWPFIKDAVDVVVGPALGGILLAYGVADQLGARAAFLERENDSLVFRRGFKVEPHEKVLLVEDVITKGTSVREMIEYLKHPNVIGLSSIIERSMDLSFELPQTETLAQLYFPTYKPDECPLCKIGIEVTKRGSR